MLVKLSIAVKALPLRMLASLSVDDIYFYQGIWTAQLIPDIYH